MEYTLPTESRINAPSKPLFAALFPVSAASVGSECSAATDQANDWLVNKSYGDKAAACVRELQTALAEQEVQLSDEEAVATPRIDSRESDNYITPGVTQQKAKKKSKQKNKHKKHKHKKASSPNLPVDRVNLFAENTKKIFIEELSGFNSKSTFRIDKKSDKNLWTYESIVKHQLSTYKRFGRSALGIRGNINLSGIGDPVGKRNAPSRYFEKRNRTLLKKLGRRLHAKESGSVEQYIVLGRDDSQDVLEDSSPAVGDATKLYLEGRDGDGETKPDTSLDGEVIQKVASYNRRLRENPGDIKLWLEFIGYQDHVFSSEKTGNRATSRSVIEKKLAILKQALAKNPGCLELQLAQLEICEQTWEKEDIVKEWNQLLFVHASNVELWQRYLLYQQSCLASFSVSKMTRLYHKCFRTLVPAMEGRVKTARTETDLSRAIVDIFYQYCVFLQQTGHSEKAVASFQALIEFNLCCPAALQSAPLEDCCAVFERFWDSSVPRFGEDGAVGWAAWNQQTSVVQPRVPQTEANIEEAEEEIISQNLPTWQTWLQIEGAREAVHWLPWCPDLGKNETEDDCEDLERLVLVDDVLPILFRVQDTHEHFRLVLYFLTFLGLDTSTVLSDLFFPQLEAPGGHFQQLRLDKLLQLGSVSGFRCCVSGVDAQREQSLVQQRLVSGILVQAVQAFPGKRQTAFTLLRIHNELEKHEVQSSKDITKEKAKALRKFVKNLLKEKHNRSNLTVWNAYTWLEHRLGKTEAALGVVDTALTMFSGGDGGGDKPGISLLYLTYCQLTLGVSPSLHFDSIQSKESASDRAKSRVTSAVASLAHESPFKPDVATTLLSRTMRKLKSFVGRLAQDVVDIASNSIATSWERLSISCQHLLSHTGCLALYELCHQDIASVLAHYTDILSTLDAIPREQSYVRTLRVNVYRQQLSVVQQCMSSGGVPLRWLRRVLDAALSEFPEDVLFLSCMVDVELKSHIVGRLRQHMDKAVARPRSPVPVICSVLAEMKRISLLSRDQVNVVQWSTTGVMNRIRSLLEVGSENCVSQHCPLMWRLYYQLEATYGDRERVVGVFYKALQQCPWAKVLYTDGVRLFGADRLEELVDLMTEKELRVEIPVEEVELLTQPHSGLDAKAEPMDASPEPLDPKAEPIETSPDELDIKAEPMEASSELLDPKEEPIETSPKPLDPKTEPMEAGTVPIETSPDELDPKAVPMEASSEPPHPKAEPIETSPDLIYSEAAPIEIKPEPLDAKT